MKMNDDYELRRQLITLLTMVNFITAVSIVSVTAWVIYRVGTWIWG